MSSAVATGGTTLQFKRRFLFRLVAVMMGGMILDGYILGVIGPVTDTIQQDLGLSDVTLGLVAAGPLFGIFIGAPLMGWATDKWGRKPMFLIDMGLFLIASALQFFVTMDMFGMPAWVQLFIIRVLMGMAIGGEYAIGWPLLAEFSPVNLRGRLLGGTMVAWFVGFMIAYFVGTALNSWGVDWHWILGSSTFIALVLFLARLGLPESPRWLLQKGRNDEAFAIADRYMEPEEVAEVHEEADILAEHGVKEGHFKDLFNKQNLKATVFASGFWFCVATPYFAIATFALVIFEDLGFGDGSAVDSVGLTVVCTFGVLTATLLLDKVGRRDLATWPQWASFVILIVLAWWTGAPPWLLLVLLCAFSFLNAALNALISVYPGEVFPTEVRGIGTGFASAFSRIGAGIATFLLPLSIDTIGMSWTLTIAAVIVLIGCILTQALAPDTGGKSLAELAKTASH